MGKSETAIYRNLANVKWGLVNKQVPQQTPAAISALVSSYGMAILATLAISVLVPNFQDWEARDVLVRSHAYDFSSGIFLYSENHREVYEQDKHSYSIVEYKDPTEKVFARKKIEFQKSRTSPDFFLEDFRSGYMDRARVIDTNAQRFQVEHRRSQSQSLKAKSLTIGGLVVVDGGFDYFIRDNFETLSSGTVVRGNFLLTNRLDYFQCRIQKTRDVSYRGRPAIQFSLRPENFIIRQLADTVLVTYDTKSKRLLEYVGISNLQGSVPDDFPKVKIVFQYKPGQLE